MSSPLCVNNRLSFQWGHNTYQQFKDFKKKLPNERKRTFTTADVLNKKVDCVQSYFNRIKLIIHVL